MLLVLACASIALQAYSAEIPAEQRQAIEGIVHDYLMKDPEVLRDMTAPAMGKL